ncbi:MAG: DUF2062 domain-containing protein [Burkholderiales bacterium]|nr:DUF2062 domain-containing protein [Burkholderiales bacterium]
MRKWLHKRLPKPEDVRANRSLRWLGPLLRRPWLWQLTRRRVALGAAIGVFFGFLIPVLQIALSAVFAILLRANLPVAAVSTLVSNPFTYAPIFVLAYRTGSAILGEKVDEAQLEALEQEVQAEDAQPMSWAQRAAAIGKPFFLGLFIFAAIGAVITWFAVNLLWILAVRLRRRRRRLANGGGNAAPPP